MVAALGGEDKGGSPVAAWVSDPAAGRMAQGAPCGFHGLFTGFSTVDVDKRVFDSSLD